MKRRTALLALIGVLFLAACRKPESGQTSQPGAPAPAGEAPAVGPRAFVHLKDGTKIPGTIVASSQTDMVVAGDDGIEHKIPLSQIRSVEYGEAQAPQPARRAAREAAPPPERQTPQPAAGTPAPGAPAPQATASKTYELPAGSEISVRTNEGIDSGTAREGQTFDAEVTRDARDANGDVVIPRGSKARLVIKSASKGGRFRGASDLVLDLASVTIRGKQYELDTADISRKGKSGLGANRRTAEYTGGGAALGAIIGAIAGGGKGAAIGAGAGAGAGALTQILTRGGSIKVPAESVLTFRLDKPLRVTAAE